MAFTLKSYQEILAAMVRKVLSQTGLNDMSKGSVISTFLEAAAQEDFAQYGTMIEILDNFSLDNVSGIDLDNRASEFGLSRLFSTPASGYVTISDSSITKVFSSIYIGSTPPIVGDLSIKVADGSSFVFPGSIYIGRGTANFEGPIALSGLPVNHVSYWELPLAAPLAKNHNFNESVILAQGGNRIAPAGAVVKVPANNISPEVTFALNAEALLADGEDSLANVLVTASIPGTTGNISLNTITSFSTSPFSGAAVTNPTAFSNARDLESDEELRDRIKTTIQSLARGTATAILSGVIGVVDPDDNKRVASAALIEPTTIEQIAKLFIDDGTGFEPSFSGQGEEIVMSDAAGTEQFLQLGYFPLVKAQVVTTSLQPYNLVGGETLIVRVNDVEETLTFLAADFQVSGAAKALEVAAAINNRATSFEARTTGGQKQIVIFAKSVDNEKIQVVGGTANTILSFPVDEVYTLKLYKNDALLSKDGETAFLESAPVSLWSAPSSPSYLIVQIDNKPKQYLKIFDNLLQVSSDGINYIAFAGTILNDLGASVATASISQWVTVLDQMIAGATVTQNGSVIKIESNLPKSSLSMVALYPTLVGSDLLVKFGFTSTVSIGKASDYVLNRFNGQIELVTPLVAGDEVTAGTALTAGTLTSLSATSGNFDLTATDGRAPALYIALDGASAIRQVNLSSYVQVTNPAGNRWRYTAKDSILAPYAAFTALTVGDYAVIIDHTVAPWIGTANTGIFKVYDVDAAGTWFEVLNVGGVITGNVAVSATTDIQAFYSPITPQKITLTSGVRTISQIVDEINLQLIGGAASIYNQNFIHLSTNSLDEAYGSIHVPVVVGVALNLGFSSTRSLSMTPHVAAVASREELGFRVLGLDGSLTSSDTTNPFTTVTDTARTFLSDGTNEGQIIKYQTGTNMGVKSPISIINLNTVLMLRDVSPVSAAYVNKEFLNKALAGDLYQQFYSFDFDGSDNLVVVLDGDDTNKTHNIPMYRNGRISAASGLSTLDGLDTDANVVGTSFGSSLWSGYDFADYKIWLKARAVINPTNDKNAFILRAKNFGPTGNMIRFSIAYPVAAASALAALYSPTGTSVDVTAVLGSGPLRVTTQDATTEFTITLGAGTITYTWTTVGTNPGFGTVAVGDIVTFSATNFNAANNGTFKISATDNATFITVLGTGFAEANKTLGINTGMLIYPLLATNTGTALVSLLNSTAIVKDAIEAVLTTSDPFGTSNDGSGLVIYSTKDDAAIASQWTSLVDGENWIRSFSIVTPQFTLKKALSFISVTGGAGHIYEIQNAPNYGTSALGEMFRLVPTTADNVVDHLNKSAITAVSSHAAITKCADGEKVQIASKLVGAQGSVEVTGGFANASVAAVQGPAATDAGTLKLPVLTSAIGGFHKGQMIRVENTNETKKINAFTAGTQVEVQVLGATSARYLLTAGDIFYVQRSTSQDATTVISIEYLSQNVMRYRWVGGTDPNFVAGGVLVDDFVEITGAIFTAANTGTFKVVSVTNDYFDIVNTLGVVEQVTLNAASNLLFYSNDSAMVGDKLNVGVATTSWFSIPNQGIWTVFAKGISGGRQYVDVVQSAATAEGPLALGANSDLFYILEKTPFVTYRTIVNMASDPSNTLKSFIYFTPITHANRFSDTNLTSLYAVNKLGYSTDKKLGVDGYQYWTGLLRRVQRTVDGFEGDALTFPGLKAAGVQVEVTPPLLQEVSIGVDVRTTSGTPLSILTDSIKSTILAYINSLGVGQDVVLSQIVKRVQEVPGVDAVRVINPAPVANIAPERIVIQDNEKAFAFDEDVTVG